MLPMTTVVLVITTIETSANAELGATYEPLDRNRNDVDFIDVTPGDTISSQSNSNGLARLTTIAEAMGVLWFPPQYRSINQRKLNAVSCGGEVILVTLPVDHRIGSAVEASTLAITIIGCCIIFLLL
jgi:hypothetical protein